MQSIQPNQPMPQQPMQQPMSQQPMPQQPIQQPMPQQPMQQPMDNQRQLPPLPKVSNQQSHPNIALYSCQRPMIRNTSSMGSIQSTGSNISLQSSASRVSLAGMSSTQSMQSMESSDAMISQQPSEPLLPTQTFPVIYNNVTYKVDPKLLMYSSPKFKELIEPFMKDNQVNPDIRLEIVGCDFTNRNMNNFLKLCQNLPTDVQNSEMKEICEIAKMFQAEKIYDTGASFIQNNLDPNFSVDDSKYDGSNGKTHMFIECSSNYIHHVNLTDLDFDQDVQDEDEESSNENEEKENVKNNCNGKPKNNKKAEKEKSKKIKSVIYSVQIENHSTKCSVYRCSMNGEVLFTAKRKDQDIYIGKGDDVHIANDSNHVARIYQDKASNNFIFIDHDQYVLKYVDSGKPNTKSVAITFPYKDRQIVWTPKTPKYNALKNKYYLNYHGEYHHHPLHSRRNIVLQNPDGHSTFIARKMEEQLFELEALPVINPLLIFAIGLSDIIGPYGDTCIKM